MKYKKTLQNKYFHLLLAFLLLTATGVKAQCTSWGISAMPEESLCAASGKITLSFTGTGAGNVTNLLYSLDPVVPGGLTIPPNTSMVFENIPAGNYIATAKGICSGQVVSATVNVTVPGTYVPFSGTVTQQRIALHGCNTGQAYVNIKDGKLPFTVTIINKPAGYTGRTSFVVSEDFVIDSMPTGDYVVSITDACAATSSIQPLQIAELPVLPVGDLRAPPIFRVGNSCSQFVVQSPFADQNSIFVPYMQPNTPITYSVSFDGMPKTTYKKIGSVDTITLPEGKSLADAYGKTLNYYITTPCGEEVVYPFRIPTTQVYNYQQINCSVDFDDIYRIDSFQAVCYPVYISIYNDNTKVYRYDTLFKRSGYDTIAHIPFGNYRMRFVTADGAVLYDVNHSVPDPGPNPYQIGVVHNSGDWGNDGAIKLFVARISGMGNYKPGDKVELISPSNYTFSRTIKAGEVVSNVIVALTTSTPQRFFYPGTYVFRVTDECGVRDLTITATESDVYRYNFAYEAEQTCTGLRIKPTGSCMYKNASQPVYYRILSGPLGDIGFDNTIVSNDGYMYLPSEGKYRLGMSASNTIILDNSSQGTTANLRDIDFKYQPLIVDVNKSMGWTCPGQPDNSGTIQAYGLGGSKINTGVYTFKLAAQGQGGTGPYWATNTTGRFSTAASGGAYTLVKDQNYDVRVEDECGNAAVQTLKIIDFETAELAKADKEAYCVGEAINFSIINLPATAITYAWTGPDNFTSTSQNPVLYPVTEKSGGNYHVIISSDICQNPIHADVNVTLAPFVMSCYSVVTEASVNPYKNSLLGNWKPVRTYRYFDLRTETVTTQPTNIRTDGTINNFVSFWQQGESGWKPQYDNMRWVWTTETTLFNKKGLELENVDQLNRYNAGIYGFDNALNMAVIQNSRYRESAYEGFEDYFFGTVVCDDACTVPRSFDFSAYKDVLDSTQAHTGKYSLRIDGRKSAGISVPVSADNTNAFSLSFKKTADNCTSGGQVLDSILTNKDAIVPTFSPIAGKRMLISAWVKVDMDCKSLTYTGNRMVISCKRGTTSTVLIAMPKGNIIDGWQRYEQPVDIPADATELIVSVEATGDARVYLDDLRIHPYNANMRSFVYNPADLRMMAELDENNYATFYEYDDDGTLIRLKKETEGGIKLIRETRSAMVKE